MTYKELLAALLELTPEQLEYDVTLIDRGCGEIHKAGDMILTSDLNDPKEFENILDGEPPLILFN